MDTIDNTDMSELKQIFSKLSSTEMKKVVDIFQKAVQFDHDDFDFSETKPAVVEKTFNDKGEEILGFNEMRLNPKRSRESRQSGLWRRSCAYWLGKFKSMNQPVGIYYSKYERPELVDTVYLREVSAERAEITKIVSRRPTERTYFYSYVFGLDVPETKWRKIAKRNMKNIFNIPDDDSEEFISFLTSIGRNVPEQFQTSSKRTSVDIDNVGQRFERQLEWHYNMMGYHVDPHGFKTKKNDEGVDLILVKNGQVDLVQAKAYSKNNTLSPSDVDIIYGQMVAFYEKHQANQDLIPGILDRFLLVVSNEESLPQETRDRAAEIGLMFEVVPQLENWPEIKCTIVKGGEKRYYTPADQHWMGCNMLIDRRRCWVNTEEEAQAKGYNPSKANKLNSL